MYENVKKAPHYFLVHFDERFTAVNGSIATGKAFVIICDGIPINVYGFTSEDEAKAFDPLLLRKKLIGIRTKRILWHAATKETLLIEINNDQRVKDGVFTLSEHATYGNIEDLPECPRMHIDGNGDLLCGKPENEYNDGCCGGCVLQGCDQEEEFYDGFKCPMYDYREKRFETKKQQVA